MATYTDENHPNIVPKRHQSTKPLAPLTPVTKKRIEATSKQQSIVKPVQPVETENEQSLRRELDEAHKKIEDLQQIVQAQMRDHLCREPKRVRLIHELTSSRDEYKFKYEALLEENERLKAEIQQVRTVEEDYVMSSAF